MAFGDSLPACSSDVPSEQPVWLGAQKRKYYRHHLFEGMEKVIADIAQIVKPDLKIVDAGNKVILGIDTLAVDVVACKFVGLDSLTIGHLRPVSEDRNEKLETFVNKIEAVEPQIRVRASED